MRILTITGMAAGFTVLFGAPLGSALFALEILHRRGLQYYEALLPAVVGSLCGYGVYIALSGAGIEPVWSFGPVGTLHGGDLAIAAAVGLAGAVGAAVFATLVPGRPTGAAARSPDPARYVLGGLLLGLLGLLVALRPHLRRGPARRPARRCASPPARWRSPCWPSWPAPP